MLATNFIFIGFSDAPEVTALAFYFGSGWARGGTGTLIMRDRKY